MKVAIVGGSGLVGRALTRSLLADGAEVVVLSRNPGKHARKVQPPATIARWSPDDVPGVAQSIDRFDAVVNVAGARVAPWPWTRRRKAVIRSSRVDGVRAIVDALDRLPSDRRPARLAVVSGIDAYPTSPVGDDPAPMTESTPMGTEFLAQVSREMEDEAQRATALGVGVVTIRMGNVLARDAALMRYLALPVRLFLGGRLGSGQQWFTWVHIDDAVALFRKAIDGTVPSGVLNATSPGAVQQADFVGAMARVLHRPAWFPAPAWLIRLVLGEQAVLLLGSRRIAPAKSQELGYQFRYPTIGPALDDVLG
jgi:uncharacterized protein (TIGR01777 family)